MDHPFNFLSKDLLTVIFEKLDFQAQTNLKQSSYNLYVDLQITNLYDLPEIFQEKLTDEILLSKQFQGIKKLNAEDNENITNIGIRDLTNLRELSISQNQNITDEGIKNLTNLQILVGNKNITDEGIKNLIFLRSFYINDSNITDKG